MTAQLLYLVLFIELFVMLPGAIIFLLFVMFKRRRRGKTMPISYYSASGKHGLGIGSGQLVPLPQLGKRREGEYLPPPQLPTPQSVLMEHLVSKEDISPLEKTRASPHVFTYAPNLMMSPLYQLSTESARGEILYSMARHPVHEVGRSITELLLRGVVMGYEPKKGILHILRTERDPLLNPLPYVLYKYFKTRHVEEAGEREETREET